MKNLSIILKTLFFLFVLVHYSQILSQSNRHPVSFQTPENNQPDNNSLYNTAIHDNPFILDTTGNVPGLTQYYDYVTNGNNLKKIFVLGDTVVIACDYTDSLNSTISTARRTYYQYSSNGGVSWISNSILLSNNTSAYPDMNPVIISGSRTLTVSGLGAPLGGFAGVDVILGAGSFTLTGLASGPLESSLLAYPYIGCVYSNSALRDSLFFRKFNYVNNTYSGPVFITPLQSNARYYITTSSNGTNVFIMWWNSTPNELKARESTDGGNSFGAVITVCQNLLTMNGESVTPWYAADLVYKPGTTTPFAVFSTLAPGNFATAQGSKVLMWSPAVNGGVPMKIADWRNMGNDFITDTSYFNNNLKEIQVGMTPLSHPTIAFSSNGLRVVCAFSAVTRDTSSYGFHFNNIFEVYSEDAVTWSSCYLLSYQPPADKKTEIIKDEIYPSLSETGNTQGVFKITYSLSGYPGSASFTNTNSPKSKVYQIYRKFCPPNCGLGISTISNEIPKSYSLEQNYPNPFNPKTIIKFDILKTSDVKISFFDITGREVQRLVQQKLNAGKYSVDFDAGSLSSGIYFYSINAGDFVQTKKMVFVK